MLSILAIVGLPLMLLIGSFISFNNNEVDLRNRFTQKTSERTAFYDKMWKIFSQKGQVAIKNDSSFRKNIEVIMGAREDKDGLMMKWVQESNPNANYSEVSALYKDLSRAIEAERDGFFVQEKYLQDIKLQHDNLIGKFPAVVFASVLGKKPLEYRPITSDRTDGVISSGKDNDVKVF